MNLWQNTCCELFVSSADDSGYLELNLSPSGDWNCFEFDDYRTGMRESSDFTPSATGTVSTSPATRGIDVVFELNSGRLMSAPVLKAGVAVVIRTQHGTLDRQQPGADEPGEPDLYYYSLQPSTLKPDFHARAGFQITLERSP